MHFKKEAKWFYVILVLNKPKNICIIYYKRHSLNNLVYSTNCYKSTINKQVLWESFELWDFIPFNAFRGVHFMMKKKKKEGDNSMAIQFIKQSYLFGCIHCEMQEVELCIWVPVGLVTLHPLSSLQASLQQCNQPVRVLHSCELPLTLVGLHTGTGSPPTACTAGFGQSYSLSLLHWSRQWWSKQH